MPEDSVRSVPTQDREGRYCGDCIRAGAGSLLMACALLHPGMPRGAQKSERVPPRKAEARAHEIPGRVNVFKTFAGPAAALKCLKKGHQAEISLAPCFFTEILAEQS